MNNKLSVRRLTISAMLMAVGMLLPFLTGQIQHIGNMLCPMHLPVFICGMICGPVWGLITGFLLPLVRSMVFGMPVLMPAALAMAFELGGYGFISGYLRKKLPKTLGMLFLSLIGAMLLGRIIWGIVSIPIYGMAGKTFGWQIFVANGFMNAVPGMILQLIAVPAVVRALEKARLAD